MSCQRVTPTTSATPSAISSSEGGPRTWLLVVSGQPEEPAFGHLGRLDHRGCWSCLRSDRRRDRDLRAASCLDRTDSRGGVLDGIGAAGGAALEALGGG